MELPFNLLKTFNSGIRFLCLGVLCGLFISFLSACELDTRVGIYEAKVPPTFKLTGSGTLGRFIVVGPYETIEDLNSYGQNVPAVWEITPFQYGRLPVRSIEPIKYGVVPDEFKQEVPSAGPPDPLNEGKFYKVTAPSVNAGFRILCFKVERDRIIKVTCRER